MKRTSAVKTILTGLIAYGIVSAQPAKLKVVTTLSYLSHIVQHVGGSKVEVVALASPRQDPHYVTPTPRMNQLTYGADLFIEHGLSLDLWAKNVVDASGNPRIQPGSQGHLVATVNVPVLELPTEVSRAWGDIHPQGNPHCWLDPLNVRIITDNIADRLAKLDPANASSYLTAAEGYKGHLDAEMFGDELVRALGKRGGDILTRKAKDGDLLSWLEAKHLSSKLGGWMEKARTLQGVKVVSYHKTYVYFANRFGLQIVGELEDKPGIPPPPQRRDAVVDLVRREDVKVILNDNFYSREAAEFVASKTSAKVIVTYIDVGASEEVDTYEKLITSLVEKIAQAVHP